MSDVEKAFKALSAKQRPYTMLMDYADGQQPLVYSTARLQEAFRNIQAHFQQNWCSVIINAVSDRLVLTGLTTEDQNSNKYLESMWNDLQIKLEAYDAHTAALTTSEAFILVWPDDGQTQLYYNDPRLCQLFYQEKNPKKKDFAAKWWTQSDGYYLNLYYGDRIEHYRSAAKEKPRSYKSFEMLDEPEVNPYGVIPVFHLRLDRCNHNSEITQVITLQDAVNKLFADMMVSAEFGAFKQRYVISNSDTASLKNAPNEIWTLPEGSSVGQFEETSLNGYLTAIEQIAASMAIITRTPKYFLFNTGSGISGDALIAMEAPLNKKVEQRQENFSTIWQEIGSFLLLLGGFAIPASKIRVSWKTITSVQPLAQAQTRQASVAVGMPLKTILKRDEGWTEAEIEQLETDQQDEKAMQSTLATILLEDARQKQEQANA
jgi:hypothetical protein